MNFLFWLQNGKLRNMKESLENLAIVILAAGKGTRMKSDEPKALARLKGKPFLEHIVDTVEKLNLPLPPTIVVGHQKEKVISALGSDKSYAVQAEQLGTGHAVMSAKEALDPSHDTVLVLSADQPLISKETIEKIISTHKKEGATITLGTAIMPDFEDWRTGIKHFGRIVRNEKGEVERIVEFRDATDAEKEITEVNPAIYAFDAKWLWENIDNIKNENAQKEYYLPDLVKMAFEQNLKVQGVPVVNILEALQPNTKEELEVLESLIS